MYWISYYSTTDMRITDVYRQAGKTCSDRSAATPRPDSLTGFFSYVYTKWFDHASHDTLIFEIQTCFDVSTWSLSGVISRRVYKERVALKNLGHAFRFDFKSLFLSIPFCFCSVEFSVLFCFSFCVSALISIARPSPAPFCLVFFLVKPEDILLFWQENKFSLCFRFYPWLYYYYYYYFFEGGLHLPSQFSRSHFLPCR